MKLLEIAKVVNAQVAGNRDIDINWLLTDSRSLSFSEQTLFFALDTGHRDGAVYIPELYDRGVRAFVINDTDGNRKLYAEKFADAVFLMVGNSLRALQQLAEHRRMQFNIPVIGITGSNGKTIVKEWLYMLLRNDYNITRSPRSYNSQIGVPLSVWQLNVNTQLGVFEAGISKTEEMQHLQPIIQPTIGIMTNLGHAHQNGFTSLQEKCEEKIKLFKGAKVIIYPKDDKLVNQCITTAYPNTEFLTWGYTDDADIKIISTKYQVQNTKYQVQNTKVLIIKYQYKGGIAEFPFSQLFIEDACSCLAVLLYLGYSSQQIAGMMQRLEPVAMRLEVKQGHQGNLIINDSYNTDLTSLRIAVDMLDLQADAKHLQKTLIISDIPQQGMSDQELYERVEQLCEARKIDEVIAIGSNITRYLSDKTEKYLTTDDFLSSQRIKALRNRVILLKGARDFRFERISAVMEQRLHETKLEINLSALAANLNHFRSLLRPETKIVSMVKANAYGVGSVEVSKTLQHHRADYLAVALADEGVELRNEGIYLPIIVMDPEEVAMDAIIAYNLEPNIYNFTTLANFNRAVQNAGLSDYPVHIKIDSGMHRLGFEYEDMDRLISEIKSSNLKIRSVFSHLAGSDDPQFDSFTLEQINRFSRCADKLIDAFDYKILKHILNSAGIERFTQYQFDMVRLGISHYGFSSLPDVKLQNVCTLKTIILQIKTVHAGESVGYSRKTFLSSDRRIAVIPIGYADGFDRHLSNGVGEVLIHGRRCKVIGNICMDQAMVDVTDIPDVKQGDEVVIFGDELPLEEMAAKLGTITYEILTSISPRVARVYYNE